MDVYTSMRLRQSLPQKVVYGFFFVGEGWSETSFDVLFCDSKLRSFGEKGACVGSIDCLHAPRLCAGLRRTKRPFCPRADASEAIHLANAIVCAANDGRCAVQ